MQFYWGYVILLGVFFGSAASHIHILLILPWIALFLQWFSIQAIHISLILQWITLFSQWFSIQAIHISLILLWIALFFNDLVSRQYIYYWLYALLLCPCAGDQGWNRMVQREHGKCSRVEHCEAPAEVGAYKKLQGTRQ